MSQAVSLNVGFMLVHFHRLQKDLIFAFYYTYYIAPLAQVNKKPAWVYYRLLDLVKCSICNCVGLEYIKAIKIQTENGSVIT